ncbi:NADH-quinone oxidoreductase subunit L [Commensalibacter papalotli (ex Botero et al. 2024)]|uniref:NADH-quinone oxidoreductase subunit L n=1 Tax=Commensalibacter papalotli (ex Botero et al. 2024) TaxID=2972766 RepID=UPI0022FFA949|nr:NADH-quinone oxidoreductase subunit L [Commensalibacter papalotli (ex Botero et al. 2024)]CAI3929948.1 Membrane H+-translocase/NADH:ubiquinone oxidoreductase subunit 5 (chain L)/Multisubunit Na+/H+ antiporter [Commensalibacter papalotli (ex Botero et al. 2024)]
MTPIASSLFAIAVFAPLGGFLIAGLLGRVIGDNFAKFISILGMIIAVACSWCVLGHLLNSNAGGVTVPLIDWIHAGNFNATWYLRMDMLSVSMLTMVTSVSLLVHIYSIGYMAHDSMPTYRFFAYLSLFTFSMLMLITSDNLIELFFGWEAVGLSSYLLIGYWYTRPSAVAAAIKAFVVNRIADLFFLVGICVLFILSGSVFYDDIFHKIPELAQTQYHLCGYSFQAYEFIALLLFIGAMGKSAQLFLHVWLPDAMEGPTPVSALIHAATMVTAGIFLMARMSPLVEFAPHVKMFIVIIGATTAFFAGTVALAQPDIKKSIAYSTCSQLGYMFVAVGVGAYQVALFHLTTHAFFKALLFLGAGSVIHALHDEQDMFKMGGLYKKLPATCLLMWIGCLALGGIFPFAGYWSKDAILEAAWMFGGSVGHYAWIMTAITAFLTAFYSWRLLFLVFHGKPRDQKIYDHAHESSLVMTLPMCVLATGATIGGIVLAPYYIGVHQVAFWGGAIFNAPSNQIMSLMHHTPYLIAKTPLVLGVLGIIVAFVCYIAVPKIPVAAASGLKGVYQFLLNAWYFDKLYDFIFVRPYLALSKVLWKVGDEEIVQGMPVSIARITNRSAKTVSWTQNGSFALYAFTMAIGLVVVLATFLIYH